MYHHNQNKNFKKRELLKFNETVAICQWRLLFKTAWFYQNTFASQNGFNYVAKYCISSICSFMISLDLNKDCKLSQCDTSKGGNEIFKKVATF